MFTVLMKVNFTCQLDWVTECPDTWSNVIPGMSRRLLPDEKALTSAG